MAKLAANTGHRNVAMLGIGAYRPRRLVSNDEVCEVLDSTDEWIYERSGIRNRRWISGDESARSMAAAAAERAISNSGVAKEEIGALILATNLVMSEVFGHVLGLVMAGAIAVFILCLWWVLPAYLKRMHGF